MLPALLGALAASHYDHFFERRLRLLGKLGAVDVVAPAPRGGAEGDAGRFLAADVEAGDVDYQAGLARSQQTRGQRAADTLVQGIVLAVAAKADQKQPSRRVAFS